MITTLVKWISLAASLLLAALAWTPRAGTGILLVGFVVFAGLIVTLVQACARRKYAWALLLIPLAIVCNPILPIPMAAVKVLVLNLSCAITFAACLMFLRSTPRMTIDSITNPSTTSESL
jgi:hypothetical protein